MIATLIVVVFGGGSLLALAALACAAAGVRVDRIVEHAKVVGRLRDRGGEA